MIVVTGETGFIGSNFVLDWLAQSGVALIGLDALAYAGNLENLALLQGDPRHVFVKGSIDDFDFVAKLPAAYQLRAVVNLTAESHVDRRSAAFHLGSTEGTYLGLKMVSRKCQ